MKNIFKRNKENKENKKKYAVSFSDTVTHWGGNVGIYDTEEEALAVLNECIAHNTDSTIEYYMY